MPYQNSVSSFIVVPGLLLVVALACTVMKLQYSTPPLETLLSLFLAFVLASVAIIAKGVTGEVVYLLLKDADGSINRYNTSDSSIRIVASHSRC